MKEKLEDLEHGTCRNCGLVCSVDDLAIILDLGSMCGPCRHIWQVGYEMGKAYQHKIESNIMGRYRRETY